MRSKILAVITAGVLAAACHNNQQVKRGEQNYDVVQEGQTDTVSSTISGPGETPPPTNVPLTGTNADTTTAFTLPATVPNGSMQQPQSPTIAGTMPPSSGAIESPMIRTPQTTTRPRIVRTPDKTVITNTAATDTVAIAPTQTDTAQTNQTQAQPPEENRKQQPPAPPSTDTSNTTDTTTTSKPPL